MFVVWYLSRQAATADKPVKR